MWDILSDYSKDAIASALRQEGFSVAPENITSPSPQGGESYIAFFNGLVAKFFKPVRPNPEKQLLQFEREPKILKAIEGKIDGMQVPKLIGIGEKFAMHVMTKLDGEIILHTLRKEPDFVFNEHDIRSLASFLISFDDALSGHNILPNNKWQPSYLNEEKIKKLQPDMSELLPMLRQAHEEVLIPPPFGRFCVQNDLNVANIFRLHNGNLGIVDFGIAAREDPHYMFAKFLLDYGEDNCRRLTDAVNAMAVLKQGHPWIDIGRTAKLAGGCLADAASWLSMPLLKNHIQQIAKFGAQPS